MNGEELNRKYWERSGLSGSADLLRGNPQSPAEFAETLRRIRDAAIKIRRLNETIEAYGKELALTTEAYAADKRALFKMMEQMDVKSEGNAGYEARMTWFLTELYAQIAAKP